MTALALTADQANAVFDVLALYAGAVESMRDEFVYHQTKDGGCREFRFVGRPGVGGKFWHNSGRWYVSTYSEELTADRSAIIDRTNAALAALREEAGQP